MIENTPVEEQQKDVDSEMSEDTKARLQVEVKEKQESSSGSRIPFLDKLVGNKEDPAVISKSSLAAANITKVRLAQWRPTKKEGQVILSEQTAGKANVDGDIGLSNLKDKDIYSTRS